MREDQCCGVWEYFEVAVSKSLQIPLMEVLLKCKIFLLLNDELGRFWWLLFVCLQNKKDKNLKVIRQD